MVLPNRPNRYLQRFGNNEKLIQIIRTIDNLQVADSLRRLDLILKGDYRTQFIDKIDITDLTELIKNFPMNPSQLIKMQSKNLLPTPKIIEKTRQGEIENIEEVISDIIRGNFDLENELMLELEYSRYIFNGEHIFRANSNLYNKNMSFQNFKRIPYLENKKVVLNDVCLHYVNETANEAIKVLEIIQSKMSDVPLLVIGNLRYGSFFVVNPIEEYLKKLGVKVTHECCKSTNFDYDNNAIANLGIETINFINTNDPNIIVVDGTMQSENNESNTRFPAAMWGYINRFKEYKTNLFAQKLTDKVYIGHLEYQKTKKEKDRELTIISSSSRGKNYSGAYFDDVERLIDHTYLSFTSKGIGYVNAAKNSEEIINEVQRIMKKIISTSISI